MGWTVKKHIVYLGKATMEYCGLGLEADIRHSELIPSFSDRVFFQDFHVRCSWAFRIFDCDNSKSIDVTEFGASVKVCTRSICQSRFLFSIFPQKVFKDFSTGGLEDFWRSWRVRHYRGSGPDCWRPCWHLRVSSNHLSMVWYEISFGQWIVLPLGTIVENHCHFNLSHGFLSKTIDNSIVPKYTIWYDSFGQKSR